MSPEKGAERKHAKVPGKTWKVPAKASPNQRRRGKNSIKEENYSGHKESGCSALTTS